MSLVPCDALPWTLDDPFGYLDEGIISDGGLFSDINVPAADSPTNLPEFGPIEPIPMSRRSPSASSVRKKIEARRDRSGSVCKTPYNMSRGCFSEMVGKNVDVETLRSIKVFMGAKDLDRNDTIYIKAPFRQTEKFQRIIDVAHQI